MPSENVKVDCKDMRAEVLFHVGPSPKVLRKAKIEEGWWWLWVTITTIFWRGGDHREQV